MLVDFLVASSLALLGLNALSTLATETLALNREITAYTMASNVLADFSGRWQLHSDTQPSASSVGLCDGGREAWLTDWCADAMQSIAGVIDDPQVCILPEDGVWQVRMSWEGVPCDRDDQPQVRRALR